MVVYDGLLQLLTEQYVCDPEVVSMASTLDELNLSPNERSDIALVLEELYGVPIPTEALEEFYTVEDLVGYIEDRL